MSGITGLGTSFNLPNYHGELFGLTPTETPLLSLSGGVGGGKQTDSPVFEWQTEDLRDPAVRARLEGADAPTAESRVRANVENVAQIFQEAVNTSYTKLAATGQYANGNGGEANPVQNEHSHQVELALKTIARDVNFSMWHGVKNKPSDNTTARQMGGLLSVVTSNRSGTESTGSAATDTITVTHALSVGDKVVFSDVGVATAITKGVTYYVQSVSTTVSFKVAATSGGSAITIGTATVKFYAGKTTLTVDGLETLMQSVFDNGGITDQAAATLFCSSRQKRALTAAYAAEYGKADPFNMSRTVAGLNLQTIETNFGSLNVVVDRALPADTLAIVSLEQIDPVLLAIPGKGVLFEEELAKTGASEKTQIYGEIGLKYGNQAAHGIFRGLAI